MDTVARQSVLVFAVEDRRFALPLLTVDRVVRAVEITPLPSAPAVILGVINVQGRVVPVVNTRQRLGLPERELDPNDRFIIGHTSARVVALVADVVEGVFEFSDGSVTASDEIVAGMGFVQGVIKTGEGLVLVPDVEKFLSQEEFASLEQALRP